MRGKRIPVKIHINVGYFSVDCCDNISPWLHSRAFKKANLKLYYVSYVNWILGWKLFNMDKIWSTVPIFTKVLVSSTYPFQKLSCAVSKGIKHLSKWTINIPASSGPNREPLAIPSVSKQTIYLNVKCTFFVHNKNFS